MSEAIAKRTLYDISADLQSLEALLIEMDGELPSEQIEAIIDQWFEEIGEARDAKLDGYASLCRELETRSQMREVEAKRLAQRAQVDKRAAERLKERLKLFFQLHNIKVIETQRFRVTLATAGGKQAMTLLVPPEQLPEEFQIKKTVIEPDKETIRHILEKGESLPCARLEPRTETIRIK